jgi:hypothetical protein
VLTWLAMVENVFGWPDFMTLPVDLVPGIGEKTIFMSFRNGGCNGNTTVRTITLGQLVPDPANLVLAVAGASEALLDWDDLAFGSLDVYNVYRAAFLPGGWQVLSGVGVPAGTSTFTDSNALLDATGEIRFYYVTAVDTLGNESSEPPD